MEIEISSSQFQAPSTDSKKLSAPREPPRQKIHDTVAVPEGQEFWQHMPEFTSALATEIGRPHPYPGNPISRHRSVKGDPPPTGSATPQQG